MIASNLLHCGFGYPNQVFSSVAILTVTSLKALFSGGVLILAIKG
ncbi:hypothetical protein [Flammeovirga agarivorans]|nr:hypothetical protein [Flammeovirga agarivorans]